MKKVPQFLRKFSKERSPEARQQAALVIKAKRAEFFDRQKEHEQRQVELGSAGAERELQRSETLQLLAELRAEVEELSGPRLGEWMNFLRLRKLRADMVVGERSIEDLSAQRATAATMEQALEEEISSPSNREAMDTARTMLSDFYTDQEAQWVDSEYTPEDIMENFSEEHLASLLMEEYVLLLKRFPSEMVTHVTRQGIRDHTGLLFHEAGKGAYANSFMEMASDGRLRSPLGVALLEGEKKEAIARFLHLDELVSKEAAMARVGEFTNLDRNGQGSYGDRTAIHFATQEVADGFYGSERGNEIFVTYPSAHIASQYHFAGQLNKADGGFWNDQWVWANEDNGMDIDAGIVFLPKEARVNPETGSRYEINAEMEPIENVEYIDAFKAVAQSDFLQEKEEEIISIAGQMRRAWNDPHMSSSDHMRVQELEPFCAQLRDEFQITDRRLQFAILTGGTVSDIAVWRGYDVEGRPDADNRLETTVREALQREGIFFVETTESESSQVFWEEYFSKNPDSRPSKVVYYTEEDPTRAMWAWSERQGLRKKSPDGAMGFPEHKVSTGSEEANKGIDRFRVLCEEVVGEYFAE